MIAEIPKEKWKQRLVVVQSVSEFYTNQRGRAGEEEEEGEDSSCLSVVSGEW